MQDAVAGTAMLTDGFEDEIDSVTPRSPVAEMGVGATPGGVGLGGIGIGVGGKKVRLYGEPGGPATERLDFKLAAAAVLSSGPGSGSDEDEVSEVESFILDQEDLDNPIMKTASELLLSSATDGVDLRTVDPETQARLEALLEAAGIGKLSTADGKAFADPEVLRRLTSSVSCALDEAAAALTRMRAENTLNAGQADNLVIFSRSLAEACSDGDVNAVRKLLDEGRSVNEHTEEGESLLCLACSAGYYELAQVLLAMHANVEDRGIKGDITPLMAAASGGYVDIVKLLLVHGADVNAQSSTGNTALTYACAGGFVDVVKVLLKEGANIEDHNENGHTPLMEAASAGHVEVARVLLEYGAGINTHSNEFKESALTLACYKGHLDMVRFLLEAGADQEHKTDEMHTALMEACMDGHVEVARLLLDSGAQVNMPADSFESPLTLAACGGHVELAALLIERGANLEEVNDEGYTPLMEAAREGHEEMVALLLAQGANINAQTEETQETALTLACCGGFLEVADFLIKAGADIELGCSTPLMEAAQEGHLELVKYLLAAGANVNRATANNDHTVVSLACAGGHLAVVELLLAHGADPTHRLKVMMVQPYILTCVLLQVPRVPFQALAMVVPPQEPDRAPSNISTPPPISSKGVSKQRQAALQPGVPSSVGRGSEAEPLPPFHLCQPLECIVEETEGKLNELGQRISAIEKAQLQSLELIQGEPLTKDKIEELKKSREEQVQKKKKILKELQKVERRLQLKTQQQFTKEYMEAKGLKEDQEAGQSQGPGPGPGITATDPGLLLSTAVVQAHTGSDTDEEANKDEELEDQPGEDEEEDDDEEEGSDDDGEDDDYPKLPNIGSIIKRDGPQQQPPLPPSPQTQPQPPPPPLQAPFVPIQPLPDYNPADYTGSTSPELQRVLGQQLAGLGPGMIPQQAPDGLMVATPAQTLTDTLDDIMAAVSSRVPMLNTTTSPTPLSQPPAQTPANITSPPSVLPLYPSVDIDAHTESNHDTALTLACAGGHEELVSVLLARGANIEHRDKKGFTPLILAATAGHVGVVEVLLDKCGDIEAQSERTKDTPLSLACSGGRQEVVELLLLRGANKEHRNVSDYTPLSLAASGGYVNIIKILLNAGAEINSRTGSKLGISPLMLAAMNGHVPAVKLLLDMGSDINAQIETNRNTALTLACFQGRAEVVSLLLDRKANVEHRAKVRGGVFLMRLHNFFTCASSFLIFRCAHIDVRNKKGNTPLWLAANGGHFEVVQLLVHASADVDAADNRKITPLMAAFRKGHVKVVQYLVKEVNQFPSDIECMRYIATIADKELLKKCHQCMETIVKAKDQQAAEANKNASILLKELDLEKSREESKKQALAAKREKRKEKRKKKKEEQKRKLEEEEGQKTKEESSEMQDQKEDSADEADVPIEPPSATTTTTIGISATSPTFTTAFGKKRANVATTPSTNRKNKKNKTKDSAPSEPIILQDPQVVLAQHKADKNKIHGEPRGGGGGVTGGNSDSDPLDSTDCASESSSSGGKSQELNYLPDLTSFAPMPGPEKRHCPQPQADSKTLMQNEDTPCLFSHRAPDANDSTSNSLPSPFKTMVLPVTSPNTKHSLTSPKRIQKRDEGWKEVVRRSKKLSVPASVVSRIMGRGGCNITAIQDVTGAHIDVDKQKDKNGERMITIRGGTESTRYAVQLINALIQDPAKELEDLIPRNHIRAPGSKAAPASFSSTAGTTSGSTTSTKALSSLVTSTCVTFQPPSTSSSSSQSAGKIGKGLSSNIRQPFPVSLPLAYAHPQLALLAQTMHQIRHPRLPMAQFGGTFSPQSSTWGPFPVRPVSPGSANSSPKHNGGANNAGAQARSNSAHSEHSVTASSGTAVTTSNMTTTCAPNTSAASPHPTNPTPYNPQQSVPTPSSVRKQLFAPDPKLAGATPVSSAAPCSGSNTVASTASPAHHSSTTTANTSLEPVGPISQAPAQPAKTEPSAVAPPGKDKLPLHGESQTVSVSESINSVGFSSPAMTLVSKSEPRQQLPPPPSSVPSSEAPPPLLNPQPTSHLPTAPAPILSPRVAHPNNTVPHFSAPAPRISHRMQPSGPYYSLSEQQTQQQQLSGFVPPNKESLKQTPNQTSQAPSGSAQAQPHAQGQAPGSLQVSVNMGIINGSQMPHVTGAGKPQQIPPNFGPAGLFSISSIFDTQGGNSQVWGGCHLSTRSPPEQSYSAHPPFVMGQMENMMPPPPPDSSKAPGYRPVSQGVSPFCVIVMHYVLSFFTAISGSHMYVQQGHGGVGTPSISRQHFSPHPWSASTSGESLVLPPPTVSSSAMAPPPQPKPGNSSHQDRKVPPPIGTERLARIRQTVNPPLLPSSYPASVGQGGIWSFGVGSGSEAMSGWSQPLMSSHMMHPQLQPDQSAFSQHQLMEQDDTGIANPANNYHQPQHLPSNYIDFQKGMPMSMYGGTMLTPHPPMAEGPGGPMYNGLHAGDPAWSPIIKVVPGSADNSDPQQQVWPGTWAPHVGNVHLNHVN
uniref:Ankyrin repeat and KH domain containing 1 n=1 Tax=Oryzias melastigma TaxID=30732 RepID=A0A3B3DB52_ORYME